MGGFDRLVRRVSVNGVTVTFGDRDAVDPAKLGVPVYPNATAVWPYGATGYSSTKGSATDGLLSTKDAFETVYYWYRARLPNDDLKVRPDPGGGAQSAEFEVPDPNAPDPVLIRVDSVNGVTDVEISKGRREVILDAAPTLPPR